MQKEKEEAWEGSGKGTYAMFVTSPWLAIGHLDDGVILLLGLDSLSYLFSFDI